MVVRPSIAQEGLFQVLGACEVVALLEHLLDPAIEALHRPIGLGPARARQPMLDAQRRVQLLEGMQPCGGALARGDEAVGELFAVAVEDRADA